MVVLRADAKHSSGHVHDLYAREVLGVHREEFAAGPVGSHFGYRPTHMYGDQHGELRIEFA